MLSNPAWVFERVRRFIPKPAKLYPTLKFLFDSYGPLRCEHSGRQLFDDAAREMSLHVLKSVKEGHVSDIVGGPALYTEKGLDKDGLMTYKCSRGTSSVEGACHMNIVRRFASYNASTRLTDSILADYRLYHNINVGSVNRYGLKHQSHYSPWLVLAINMLRTEVGHGTVMDYTCERYGNFINFKQTNETFGIVDMPRVLCNEIGIKPATLQLIPKERPDKKRIMELASLSTIRLPPIGYSKSKFMYQFLSSCQGTLYAVAAVHTNEENFLFETLLKTQNHEDTQIYQPFNAKKPDFHLFAFIWNTKYCLANSNIYYKTPGHLRAYYNIVEDRKKYGNTVLKNIAISQSVRALVEDASRFDTSISTLSAPTAPQQQHFPAGILSPLTSKLPKILPLYHSRQISSSLSLPLPRNITSSLSVNFASKKRKRHCTVCKIDECPGSSKRFFCINKCGKCRQESCTGRHVKQLKTNRQSSYQPLPCLNA
ncbi:hypothetical protein BD408DRAFT_414181, partial [Parasitella parasitica]